MPPDLVVLQVGSVIGPNRMPSQHIVRIITHLRDAHPGQWFQLLGPNESKFTPGGRNWKYESDHGYDIDFIHQRLLNYWWSKPHSGVAAVITSNTMAPTLVTPAGVTSDICQRIGSNDPYDIAATLNQATKLATPYIFEGAHHFGQHDNKPGPILTTPYELWASWSDTPLPFDQIVGHIPPFHFGKRKWFKSPTLCDPTTIYDLTTIDDKRMTWWKSRHSPHGIAHIGNSVHPNSTPDKIPPHRFDGAVIEIP